MGESGQMPDPERSHEPRSVGAFDSPGLSAGEKLQDFEVNLAGFLLVHEVTGALDYHLF